MRILLAALLSLSLVTPALANPAAGGFHQTPPPPGAIPPPPGAVPPPPGAVQPAPPAAGGFQQMPSGPVVGGGFTGPSTPYGVSTVVQALSARDDTPCVLEGNIVQRVAGEDEEYIFRDATGQILVEIDHELFWGVRVTPQNLVRITGKVDAEVFRRNEIDVASLQVIR